MPTHWPVAAPERPFAAFPTFPDAPKPLNEGVRILAFFSATCDQSKATARTLLELQSMTAVYLVFFDAEDAIAEFQNATDTYSALWIRLDPALFFDHIGDAPPRVYVLNDGRGVRFWDGESPVDELRQALTSLLPRPGP